MKNKKAKIIKNVFLLIGIIIIVALFTGGCGGEGGGCGESEEVSESGVTFTKVEPTGTCEDEAGYLCNTQTQFCAGGTISASDSSNQKICCMIPCIMIGEDIEGLERVGGDKSQPCVRQWEAHDCIKGYYCEEWQWINASDTPLCCNTTCHRDITDTIEFNTVGECVVQKLNEKVYVWCGDAIIEYPESWLSEQFLYNRYEADEITGGYKVIIHDSLYKFDIINEDETSIEVVGIN